ncbi:hypothetical protein [Gilliamella sp. Gris1-4]|uniref:hypothetical protein n=1 Tax=Gilliamella sp. Gris1-4 TaxID=3120244 RepID=UPI00080DC5D4|nr:hypothetical protein [Gilliamella apicola]OCG36916.1 hypothetical protein A9G31_05160 [Gilliamella apicola]OCG68484.1 hypothetical protein A9G39_02510 [Gilliamella apicola]
MTSKKIIERLQQQDWFVECKTEHELALVLNACLDADVVWSNRVSAISLKCSIPVPALIGRSSRRWSNGLWFSNTLADEDLKHYSDITDWFFEELRK